MVDSSIYSIKISTFFQTMPAKGTPKTLSLQSKTQHLTTTHGTEPDKQTRLDCGDHP